jgi:hypothetical protein
LQPSPDIQFDLLRHGRFWIGFKAKLGSLDQVTRHSLRELDRQTDKRCIGVFGTAISCLAAWAV